MERAFLRADTSVNPRILRLERLIATYERMLGEKEGTLRGIPPVTEAQKEEWRTVIARARAELATVREETKGDRGDGEE
jgi:hypothetical protein